MVNSAIGTDGEKGSGIGLSLSLEFIAMNEGTIKIDSQESVGSSFLVKLPGKKTLND